VASYIELRSHINFMWDILQLLIYLDKSIREAIDRISIVDILAKAIELCKLFVIRTVTVI